MTVFTVSSQTQLDSALTQLKGGDTLQLAAGTYSLTMSTKAFASNVTITSLDPANPARLSWLKLTDSSNITFKNLNIGRSLGATETTDAALAKAINSSNLTFDTVHFHGSMDGNATNDGTGMTFSGGSSIKIVNSEFEQLGRGATFGGSTNVTVANNVVHDVRSDGFDFASVRNVLIDGNTFTDFDRTSTDHPDAIQFWTTNTTQASTDIIIRNNVILQGNGSAPQGIFLRDEVGTLPYERVTIANNIVYETNMSNGIFVSGGKDITITGNTAISPTGDSISVWIRLNNISGGTVTKNLTDSFSLGTNSALVITDNLLTSQSGLSSSLLSLSHLATVSTSQLLVSGYGYQPPSSSGSTTTDPTTTTTGSTGTTDPTTTDSGGGTTTTTKPGKGRSKKSALTSKSSVTTPTSDLYAYSFSAGTLSDSLPEVQSSYGTTDTSSVFTSTDKQSGSLTKAQKKASRFAAEAFFKPAPAGFDYRFMLFGIH